MFFKDSILKPLNGNFTEWLFNKLLFLQATNIVLLEMKLLL